MTNWTTNSNDKARANLSTRAGRLLEVQQCHLLPNYPTQGEPMRWNLYWRIRGVWYFHYSTDDPIQLRFYLAHRQAMREPYLITNAESGTVYAEWFPEEYNYDPNTNQQERQPGCDVEKRRFPILRRRAAR